MKINPALLFALVGITAIAAVAVGHPASDVAPCTLDNSTQPPTCHAVGDGRVSVADVVLLLRASVGLERLQNDVASEAGFGAGDVAPAVVDTSTSPETAEAIGDGHVDISDVVLLLRNAVGRNTLSYPPVVWTPDSLAIFGHGTQPNVMRVTASIRSSISASTIWLTPSLAEWVTVTPSSLPALSAGTEVTFDLVLKPGAPDRGGTLHLREGNRTIARPLALHISGAATPLPPDPGEAGKATLAGVDSDGDGLRDDIQRYIVLTYPDDSATQLALRQYAIAVEAALVDANDHVAALRHGDEISRAQGCLWYIHDEAAPTIRKQLRAELLNTAERSRAYLQHDRQQAGHVFWQLASDKSGCDFDVDSLTGGAP